MDYCPEVAVLQSAFQLVNKLTKGKLSNLSKDDCDKYVKVIVESVEEICSGLEFDLDQEARELWQQKIHCLLFHSVVNNFYIKKVACTDKKVPVLGPLDLLSELIPTFSTEFYFELVKQCGWSACFLQCLQSLGASLSSSVLCDLLSHCEQEPVTSDDRHIISVLSGKFLARCLYVPDRTVELGEDLLKSLNQPRKYVTVVYPDTTEAEIEDVEISVGNHIEDDFSPKSEQNVGAQLFDEFVKSKSDIFNLFLSNYEKQLDMYVESTEDVSEHKMFQIIIQLEFWFFLFRVCKDDSCADWFLNNVFLTEDCNQSNSVHNERYDNFLMYNLNFVLIENLHSDDSMLKLHEILHKAIDLVPKLFKTVKGDKEMRSTDGSQHTVQVVCGLSAFGITLLRMLKGIMVGVGDAHETNMDLEEIFHANKSADRSELILGKTWKDDVTLEAYLWRVTHKLPKYQVCVDRLLGDKCLKFWTSERLPNMLQHCPSMLNQVSHVLRLSHILTSISKNSAATRETILSITNLIQTTFQELSFPDQDLIVKDLYCDGQNYLSEVMRNGINEKVTLSLNKVTAELTDNVLKEILLLCVGDPIYVLDSTLRLSTYNEQQAVSCSQIVRLVHRTCKCRHPVYHPATSLIAHCIQKFLISQTLNSKQQKNFIVFVSHIMTNKQKLLSYGYGSDHVLSPSEFVLTSVLPSLSAENVDVQTGHISSEFSLNLLLTALKACYELSHHDFFERIELMPLIATLAEIQHKCLVCCEVKVVTSTTTTDTKSESSVTMVTKLRIREQINECLTLLTGLIEKQCFMVHPSDIDWMLDTTVDMHLCVKCGICDVMSACGYHEYREVWDVTMETCVEDFVNNLVTILQLVAVNKNYIRKILDRLPHVTVSSDCLIIALVQVLPQCLSSEFGNIMSFIEELIACDAVSVTMMYKFMSTSYLPLVDYRVVKPLLYSSQLLMYAIITLALTLKQKPWQQRSMLQTVITSYVGYLKMKCGLLTSEDTTTLLIYLCELFHHVGTLAVYVGDEDRETLFILLLQILTQYVTASRQIDEEFSDECFLKLRNNLEDGLSSVISKVPGNSEAKNMLYKKLGE